MAELVTSDLFEPDWAVPPGATIAAILSSRSLSRESFADALGESVETIQRLLLGLEAINIDLADRLSRCLGSSQAFWVARERQFRADSERLLQRKAADERESWVRQFPVKEMASLGWIGNFQSPAEAADECLKLFGVPNVAAWQSRYSGINAAAAFRISASTRRSSEAVTAWLRWAELIAERTPCEAWSPSRFRERLQTARRLTWQKDPATFLPTLRRLCAEAGVAVVIARTPKGCPASGATLFLSPGKAMMVLSFRYRSDDQFWFTFFHEAGHLLLHGPETLFLEGEGETTPDEEREANEFAEETLLPSYYRAELQALRLDKEAILRFARRIGIAPGIVVGQLQHRGLATADRLNWLKRRYNWDQIETDQLIP
jgi:HTH-type transcriptional regulator/antitoxin HigA